MLIPKKIKSVKKKYRVLPAGISPELRDLINTGQRIKKAFNMSQEDFEKALKDLGKS